MVANKHLISRMTSQASIPHFRNRCHLFDNALLFLCFIVFIQFFDFSVPLA